MSMKLDKEFYTRQVEVLEDMLNEVEHSPDGRLAVEHSDDYLEHNCYISPRHNELRACYGSSVFTPKRNYGYVDKNTIKTTLKQAQQADFFMTRHGEVSIILRPYLAFRRKGEKVMSSRLAAYQIFLGVEHPLNWSEFLTQNGDTFENLRPRGHPHKTNLLFSHELDAHGVLQSEHVFLSGSTGQGKTNLCALLLLGFHKRPNPTVSLWCSQKPATCDYDFFRLQEHLISRGHKCVILRPGEQSEERPERPISASSLNPEDVRTWLGLNASGYASFLDTLTKWRERGDGIKEALEDFSQSVPGTKYREQINSVRARGLLALGRDKALEIKPDTAYLLSVGSLLNSEPVAFCDMLTNAYLSFVYNFVSGERKKLTKEQLSAPDNYKHQWQSLLCFDEYRQLATDENFKRTVATIDKVAIQGRQQGSSLVLASQTVYFGGSGLRTPSTQASIIAQFKSSSSADRRFVSNLLGYEDSASEFALKDAFDQIFQGKLKLADKGQIILFSKTAEPKLIKLELLEQLPPTEPVEEVGEIDNDNDTTTD